MIAERSFPSGKVCLELYFRLSRDLFENQPAKFRW